MKHTSKMVWIFRCVALLTPLLLGEGAVRLLEKWKPWRLPDLPSSKALAQTASDTNSQGLRVPRFTDHPFLPYIGRPLYHGEYTWQPPFYPDVIVTQRVEHNSFGFRSPETTLNKPNGTYRILVFGGSTTYGTGCDNADTWPAQLQRYMQQRDPQRTYEVINMAIDGGNSAYSLVLLSLLGLEFNPDIVIVYEGINDLWCWRDDIKPDYSHVLRDYDPSRIALRYRMPSELFRSRLLSLVVSFGERALGQQFSNNLFEQVYRKSKNYTIKTKDGMPLLLRNVDSMRTLCNSHNIAFLAATLHYCGADDKRDQVDGMREHFELTNVHYVDLDRLIPHNDISLHSDFCHFTVRGNELISRYVGQVISETLSSNHASHLTGDPRRATGR